MGLEERSLDEASANGELVIACYFVMESAVTAMAGDKLGMLDMKQKAQLFSALKNAFNAVLKFLGEIAVEAEDKSGELLKDPEKKHFVCATVRILSSWLAEETEANREEVYAILPFVLNLCQETFEAQKVRKQSDV